MIRRLLTLSLCASALAFAAGPAFAQDKDKDKNESPATNAPGTNAAPSAMSKNALELIVRNNIFDPNRVGYRPNRQRAPRVETFTFCGYALDQNPPAAFFAGSGAPRHAVAPGESVNGFKVQSVDFTSVKLKPAEGPELTLNMGGTMRKVDNGPWKASEGSEPEPPDASAANSSTNSGKAVILSTDTDLIKRLKARHNEDN